MTKQEFETFEYATYELLSNYKENIKMIIHEHDGEMDISDLKDCINEMIILEGVWLNDAYDDNLFNFISDDELAYWLQENDICYTYESIRVGVREIDYVKGEEE